MDETKESTAKEKKQLNYLFKDESEYERERMRRLNEIYNPKSQEFLIKYLKKGMSVLEIGPGDGELGVFISKNIGDGQYTALEINSELLDQIKAKINNAELLTGSVTEIESIESLKNRKFDLIYFRWVLAYIPSSKMTETLGKLYSQFLNKGGYLVCEECNLYKAHCSRTDNTEVKINSVEFDKWLKLSRDVQSTSGIDADFELGKKIKSLLLDATKSPNIEITKYQPILNNYDRKSIPVLAMRASKGFLVERKIRREESLDNLTNELDDIAQNQNISVHYLKNTIAAVKN